MWVINLRCKGILAKRNNNIIERYNQVLDSKTREMMNYGNNLIQSKKMNFSEALSKLEALSPLSILKRGYSVALNQKNHVIRSVKDVKSGDALKTRVIDGVIKSKVEGVDSNE